MSHNNQPYWANLVMLKLGRPLNWVEEGWDTPATMAETYQRTEDGRAVLCVWPRCDYQRNLIKHPDGTLHVSQQFFKHVHGAHTPDGAKPTGGDS